ILPFFNSGTRVLLVTGTKTAFPLGPRISLVIALARSISNPSSFPVRIFSKPKRRVPALPPQVVCLFFCSTLSTSYLAPELQPERKVILIRATAAIVNKCQIFFIILASPLVSANLTHKFAGPLSSWLIAKELFGGVIFNNSTISHKDNPVGNVPSKSHFVGNHQHGHVRIFCNILHYIKNIINHFWIECTRGFVK